MSLCLCEHISVTTNPTFAECLFVQFVRLPPTLLKDEESARDNYVLACNFAKYLPSFKKFTHRLNL